MAKNTPKQTKMNKSAKNALIADKIDCLRLYRMVVVTELLLKPHAYKPDDYNKKHV